MRTIFSEIRLRRVIKDKLRLETMCFKCKLLEILYKQFLYKFKAFYAQANAWGSFPRS